MININGDDLIITITGKETSNWVYSRLKEEFCKLENMDIPWCVEYISEPYGHIVPINGWKIIWNIKLSELKLISLLG